MHSIVSATENFPRCEKLINEVNSEFHTHLKNQTNSENIIIIPILILLHLLQISIHPILPVSKDDLRGPPIG